MWNLTKLPVFCVLIGPFCIYFSLSLGLWVKFCFVEELFAFSPVDDPFSRDIEPADFDELQLSFPANFVPSWSSCPFIVRFCSLIYAIKPAFPLSVADWWQRRLWNPILPEKKLEWVLKLHSCQSLQYLSRKKVDESGDKTTISVFSFSDLIWTSFAGRSCSFT